jgi:hypothetical protein
MPRIGKVFFGWKPESSFYSAAAANPACIAHREAAQTRLQSLKNVIQEA